MNRALKAEVSEINLQMNEKFLVANIKLLYYNHRYGSGIFLIWNRNQEDYSTIQKLPFPDFFYIRKLIFTMPS